MSDELTVSLDYEQQQIVKAMFQFIRAMPTEVDELLNCDIADFYDLEGVLCL